MKTLLVLISLTAIVIAAPTDFPKDVETFKHGNQLGGKNTQLHRQKKSPSATEESSPVMDQNMENGSEKLTEERHEGLTKPIVIKKIGYHRLRDTEDVKSNCESPVQVKVCEESETQKKMKPTSAARSDMAMTEHEMENSIQMAKEAVENLHRDFLSIEKNSQALNSRSDTDLDTELHSNIEIARKALENIHQNFGDLEALNLKSTTNEDDLKIESEVERLTQWKEAVTNVAEIEKARNIEDAFKSPEPTKDTSEKVKKRKSEPDTTDKNTKEMKSEDNTSKQEFDVLPVQPNIADKQRSDVEGKEMTHMNQPNTDPTKPFEAERVEHETKLKMTTETENNTPVSLSQTTSDMTASKKVRSHTESTGPMEQLENMAKGTPMITQDFKTGESESNQQSIMKSNDQIEPKLQRETPQEQGESLSSTWAQKQATLDGKQKLLDTLSTRLSENIARNKPDMSKTTLTNLNNELMENHMMSMTPENNMNTQEQMSFKMSPTGMMQQQSLNTHHTHSHNMPTLVHGHHMPKQFETTDINFDQNNVNVFQNQDNSMTEMNQQQTAEDPFFMRWASEQQRHNMGPQNTMHLRSDLRTANTNDLHNMEMHQLEMASNDQLSALENMHEHDHLHLMHHANMDSSMQPSMRMNMMSMDKPTFEYNAMQWGNQGLARNAYGPSVPSAPSGPSAPEGPGAVGIFPNAKVGGCAIPLLVSCSPSLATGSLAKAHPSSASYPAPGYRSGDMVYYMKRDAKEDDIPFIKVQRTHTPFSHKDEFILEKQHK